MERILFRTEIGRELSWNEVDNNFRYVCNPWVSKTYETDEIVYNTINGKIAFYKAKTNTSLTFNINEWDVINGGSVSVFKSLDSTLLNYISRGEIVNIGDYVLLTNGELYLHYDGTGLIKSNYVILNQTNNKTVVSSQNSISNYVLNEYVANYLNVGDNVVVNNNSEVWLYFKGFGDSVSNYMRLSSSVIIWTDIIGRPTSVPSSIDSAVSLSHTQNTDTYIGFGTATQTSSLEVRTHIDNKNVHFTQKDLILNTLNLDMIAIDSLGLDNVLACSTAIQQEVNGSVTVEINGLPESSYSLTTPCYFSNDSGLTAKVVGTESIGDFLYWNSTIAGYPLLSNYKISFKYLTPVALV